MFRAVYGLVQLMDSVSSDAIQRNKVARYLYLLMETLIQI